MAFKDFISILRPVNCLMAAIATFIGFAVAGHRIYFPIEIFYAMTAAFLVCGAGQAINDFFDLEVDKKLHPTKPLPAGRIKPKTVLWFSIILFLVGNIFAFLIGFIPLIISIVFTVLLIIYSGFMHWHKFLGNWIVAAGTAITLIFGASIIGNYDLVIVFALSAFFANTAREITKDLEDLIEDRGYKFTLPMIFSEKTIKSIVLINYLLAIILAIYAFSAFSLNTYYLILILITIAGFIFASIKLSHNEFANSQAFSKKAMLFALIAFFVSIL